MSYAANKEDYSESNHFAVIKPRSRLKAWDYLGSNVWECPYTQDEILSYTANGTDFTETLSSTPPAGNYYYLDKINKKIRIYWTPGGPYAQPLDVNVVSVVTYPLYLGTISAYLTKTPTDPNSGTQFFDGYLQRVPTNKFTMADSVYAALPSQSSTLTIVNADGKFLPIFHSDSFKDVKVDIYHCLGATDDSTNFRKVFTGYCSDVTVSDDIAEIRVYDVMQAFDRGFDGVYSTHGTDVAFPVPTVFGIVEGVKCKLDSISPNPTYFVAQAALGSYKTYQYQFLFPNSAGSGANTTTKTYINTLGRIKIGDRLILFNSIVSVAGYYAVDAAASRKEYVEVTAVGRDNVTGKPWWIQHTAIGSAMPSTTYGAFAMVARKVTAFIDGTAYKFFPYRDYEESFDSNGASKITMKSGYVAGAALPRALLDTDTVFTRVYGIDADDLGLGAIINQNMISIIYLILTTYLKIPTTEIEAATFTALANDPDFLNTRAVSLSIPAKSTDEFPTYRDLLSQLLGAGFLKLFINKDGKWDIRKTAALASSSTDIALSDAEIGENSLSFEYQYGDIVSDIIVEYADRDISDDPSEYNGKPKRVVLTSLNAKYFHKTVKQKTFRSPFGLSTDAEAYASLLRGFLGERRGLIKFRTSLKESDAEIGNVVEISRTRLPGYSYDGETENLRKGAIVELDVGTESISMTLDDQKGMDAQET